MFRRAFRHSANLQRSVRASLRNKWRLAIVLVLAVGMFAQHLEVPDALASTGLSLEVDYTPDAAGNGSSVLHGDTLDLTAGTPVTIEGTTEQEIIQQIGPELQLRSVDNITAPSGWTISYSTNGTTWTTTPPSTITEWDALRYVKANGPLVSEGADASGRQISSAESSGNQPDSGQFSTANTASGDGWDVIFDNNQRVYNIWHNRETGGLDCHLRSGERCNGTWPYTLGSTKTFSATDPTTFKMASSANPSAWFDAVDNEIWIPTVFTEGVAGGATISKVGFVCISLTDITATNKWCGGSAATAFISPGGSAEFSTSSKCADALYDCYQGVAASGGRVFTWATKTGDLVCIDIRLNGGAGAPCLSGGTIDFGANLPDANKSTYWASLGEWEGRIYGRVQESSSAGKAVCVVASTGAACPGWVNPRSIINSSRFAELPGVTAGAPSRGICFLAPNTTGSGKGVCFDGDGVEITSSLTPQFLAGYATAGTGSYTNYNPTHGTRMYWGSGSASSTGYINCWDFALNNWCVNWTPNGLADSNYQITLDPMKPTCIWSNAHDTIIQTYNATTGTASNCAVPPPIVNFDADIALPRMACATNNSIQAWRTFRLITNVTYDSATLTVKNGGTSVSGWSNVVIPQDKIVDLSSLSISATGQTPTFTVTFTNRNEDGEVGARISAIGGSPELCLRVVVPCPTPIVHPSQLSAGTSQVVASGSTVANGVVTQFDPVTSTIQIADTPLTNCATSLTGTLTTGAGAAVAGVIVTLTDTSGTALIYPSDYPDVALRGQQITAISDASGAYSFPLVAAGSYKVKFVDASQSVVVNQAIVEESGSGLTSDYTSATSLLSPSFTLATGTPGVVNAKYNSNQTLTKSFWPTVVNTGQVATLTFTITKIDPAAKTGIGWVDSLPTGMVIDANPNTRTTCPGGSSETLNPAAMTATPGATSITVSNTSINVNVTSCTFSVNVKATSAGSYLNGPSNVTTTNIDKSTNATVEALNPITPGGAVCDNNVYYLQSGQLYRHPSGSLDRYAIGPTYTSGAIDAIGYNSLDGYLYGITRNSGTSNGVTLTAGHLVRISGTGIIESLGSLSDSTITDTLMATMVGGDFDNSGNLVVKASGSVTTLYSINVATRVATKITTTASMDGGDMAFSQGHFFSSSGSYIYKTAVSAGTTWTTTRITMFPSNVGSHQTAYSDGSGRAVFVDGNSGAYATTDPLTATASSDFTKPYTYQTNPLDGAMCHAVPVPTADPDTTSAGRNVTQSINLLDNDAVATNAVGVTLVASSVKLCDPNTNPAETAPLCTKGPGTSIVVDEVGTYAIDANGVVTFTPVTDYLGIPPALGYQVSDSNGYVANSTYTPTVLNTIPSASNDTSSGPYNTDQTITPLTNDTAGSLAALNSSSVKLCDTITTTNSACTGTSLFVPDQGTYTVNDNGTITFDPLPSFTGVAAPIKYVVADNLNQLASAQIQVTVEPPPAPVATAETKAVIPGGTVAFTTTTGTSGLATAAAGFDTTKTCLFAPNTTTCDADGVVEIAGEGTYTLNKATGVVTFVADVNATQGTKTAITYQVTDVTGQTVASTLTPIIPPPPTASDDTSSGAYDTNQTISPLLNDSAGTGATLVPSSLKLCETTTTAITSCTLTSLFVPNQGTYTVNANGTVTFDPLSSFTGQASPIKYVIADSTGQVTSALITPRVSLPGAPTATADTEAVIPGGTATFTTITGTNGLASSGVGLDTSKTCLFIPTTTTCDADGVVEIAGEGTYTLNTSTGVVTFVAAANATQGTKTAITYQVTDIFGQTATSTLTPIIPPPPTATDDTSSGAYDTNQTISPLLNDSAGTGATLVPSSLKLCATTTTAVTSCTLTSLFVPNQGTYTVNANGTITFDPLSSFTGQASPIKYVIADSTGQVTSALISPTVSLPGAPTATADTEAVIPGGTATFTTITGTNGLATAPVALDPTKTCLFTPNTTTCDADGVIQIVGEGTYTLNSATGVVTFVADANATQGTKTAITYQVTDIFGQTATSTLTPVIPAPPIGVNDISSGAYDTNQIINILTNDLVTSPATLVTATVKLCETTNTANTSCTLTSLFVPNQGTYTVNANGTITFDPLPSFTGQASPVKYVVADSTGQLTSALITPTVALPAAPTATADTEVVIPGGTATFTTITGTSGLATAPVALDPTKTCLFTPNTTTCDADGVVVIAGEGTYTLNAATGVVTFVADANATQGTKTSITYQVTDIFGQTATSTLTPTIPPPPTASNDTSSGAYDTNQTISPLTNDAAGTGATLVPSSLKLCATTATAMTSCTLTSLFVPNQGTYTVNANGTITFDPLPTFSGQASPIKYVIADSTGQVTSALITPTVGLPTVPTATPQEKVLAPGATVSFTTLTGSSGLAISIAGLNSTVTCLYTPGTTTCDADGVVVIAGEGTYRLDIATGIVTYTADANAAPGTKTAISYQATDIFGQTSTATLTPKIPVPPTGTNDTSSGAYDTNQVIAMLTNDAAGIGATLVPSSLKLCATTSTDPASCTLTTLTVDGEGTYTVNSDGTITFDPLPTFQGTATPVKYVVADSTGQLASATLTPSVSAPVAPSATPQTKYMAPGATISFTTLTGSGGLASTVAPFDTAITCLFTPGTTTCDADGVVVIAGEGTYTLDTATGIVTYKADDNAAPGTKTAITYQVTDIFGQTATSTLTPKIPSPPKGTNDTSSGAYDTNQIISLFDNDSAGIGADLDLTTLRLCPATSTDPAACTLTTLTVVGEGTYTINPDGTVTFDPLPTFKGTATPVKYVVADSTGQVTSATMTVNVVAPPAPKATPEVKRLKPGGTISFSPLIGPKGLANSEIALSSLGLCLITPDSNPATCDEDGVVEVPGVGVYRLNITTGVVSFMASKDFKPGTKTSVTYQMMDAAGQWVQSTLTPEVDAEEVTIATATMPATGAVYLGYLVIFAATFIGLGVSLTRKRNTFTRR